MYLPVLVTATEQLGLSLQALLPLELVQVQRLELGLLQGLVWIGAF